mmetsp:Transcript_24711/g.76325  ORF Transcript_24711/g.76325 Transcript_24711/m.76325 type:complete len:203 (-) Transcript_24711:112-720(-)
MAVPFAGVGRPFRSAHDEGESMVEVVNDLCGPALFAFRDDDDETKCAERFSGQFAFPAGGAQRQLQIVAAEERCPNACSCRQSHCKLTFFDKARGLRAVCRARRDGGNAITLSPRDAANASFRADTILADDEAADVVARFFPKLAKKRRDFLVNQGTLRLKQLVFFSHAATRGLARQRDTTDTDAPPSPCAKKKGRLGASSS